MTSRIVFHILQCASARAFAWFAVAMRAFDSAVGLAEPVSLLQHLLEWANPEWISESTQPGFHRYQCGTPHTFLLLTSRRSIWLFPGLRGEYRV